MSQLLDGIPLHELTENHINSLVLLKVGETPRIDYKQELRMSKDSEKRELCKDVSALANSQGGYLFFGVSETKGIPTSIPGVEFGDAERQRFYQILMSGISPRIQCVQDTAIPLKNGKVVLAVRTEPDGYLHQVKYDDERYYKRAGTITVSMQSSDVETFFMGGSRSTRTEQIQEVVHSYYAELRSRTYFKGVEGKGIVAMVVIPEVASCKLDMGNLPEDVITLFQPLYCSGWNSEITGRSRFTFGRGWEDRVPYAVTEVTELGVVKAFNSFMLENRYDQPQLPEGCTGYVPSVAYLRESIITFHRYLNSLKQLGVSPPFYVHTALLLVQGYILYVDPNRLLKPSRILRSEDVLPDLVLVSTEDQFKDFPSMATALRPMFDFVWREFGLGRCYDFDGTTGMCKVE